MKCHQQEALCEHVYPLSCHTYFQEHKKSNQFRWHSQHHGIPWGFEIRKVEVPPNSVEFHGTLGAIEIGKLEVAQNSINYFELWFSQDQWQFDSISQHRFISMHWSAPYDFLVCLFQILTLILMLTWCRIECQYHSLGIEGLFIKNLLSKLIGTYFVKKIFEQHFGSVEFQWTWKR